MSAFQSSSLRRGGFSKFSPNSLVSAAFLLTLLVALLLQVLSPAGRGVLGQQIAAMKEPVQRISVSLNQGVRLLCGNEPTGNAQYRYFWERPAGKVISTEYAFYIPKVDFADLGVYTCRAILIDPAKWRESVRSTELSLQGYSNLLAQNVGEPLEIVIIPAPQQPGNYIEKNLNANLYMTCEARYVNSGQSVSANDFSYYWLGPDGVTRMANLNYLFISRVEPQHVGNYTCVALDRSSGLERARNSVTLFVAGISQRLTPGGQGDSRSGSSASGSNFERVQPNGFPSSGPQSSEFGGAALFDVRVTRQPEKPLINQEYTLSCETVPPQPNVVYEWFVDNVSVSQGPRYYIPRITRDNFNKNYECRAMSNGMKRSFSMRTDLKLHISSELALLAPPGPQIMVRDKDRKELHCEIERIPQNQGIRGKSVQWFLNSEPLLPSNMPGLAIERTDRIFVSIISLNSISARNEGRYECRFGNVNKEAYVVVLTSSSGIEVNPPEQTVDVGGVVEFHCRVFALKNVVNTDLRWFFLGQDRNGARVPLRREWEHTNPTTASETSFIAIEDAQVKDDGYYLCVEPSGGTALGRLNVRRPVVRSRIIVTVSPRDVRIQPQRTVTIMCSAVDEATNLQVGEPRWRFADGRPIETDSRYVATLQGKGRSQLMAYGLGSGDDNTKVQCYVEANSDTATIRVEAACGAGSFRCLSGGPTDCIDRNKRCDGYRDCPDGSDEDPAYCSACDPVEVTCENFNGQPPTQKTFSVNWQCDGEDDCGNGFDESACTNFNSQCGGSQYQCRNGSPIPRAFVCDTETDCTLMRDDEENCNAPQISRAPQANQTVPEGITLQLTCTATGTPLPRVIWRYNWRCLPDRNRMVESSTSQGCTEVVSTLTIRNLRSGDDGIYNCEALSSRGRAISSEALVVIVK